MNLNSTAPLTNLTTDGALARRWSCRQAWPRSESAGVTLAVSMQSKVERLALKTLSPQRKSFNALGTTRSTLFAEMFLGEKFDCIVTA